MAGQLLVSVIIPTYNRAAFLAEAVHSVLAQTLVDYELIVVDDGSTDQTRTMIERVRDPRVSLLALPHSGIPARARNTAISRARGRYVAFLDSDDLWDPSKLEDQLAALAAHPGSRWCHTGGRIVDETGAPHASWPAPRVAPDGWIAEPLVRRRVGVSISTVLAERAFLLDAGGFDETFVWGEDYDLWVRLALRSPIASVAGPRVRRRIHADQLTLQPRPRVWQAPQLAILRTLARTARSAPTWRMRALSASEALRVGTQYVSIRARGLLRRLKRSPTGSKSVGAVENRSSADYHSVSVV